MMYIVIAPTNDGKLKQLTDSALKLENILKRHKKKHKIFYGSEITRADIESILNKINDHNIVIVFYGHGCECGGSLYGDSECSLMDILNAKLLKGVIIYAAACNSARMLGKHSISMGCIGYLGYQKELWVPGPDKKDPGIIKAINKGIKEMVINGINVNEAKKAIYYEFAKVAQRLLQRDKNLIEAIHARLNMDHLSLLK